MRFWKHWPYWLRGGVIGGGVAVVAGILSSFFCAPLGFFCFILSIPTIPLFPFVEELALLSNNLLKVVIPTTTIIMWFFVGSLLGLFVNFVKNKKAHTK